MEHFSRKNGTRMLFYRLNYAIDLRYGVLYDIARNVLDGTPINLDVPLFACIWQGDANEYAIRSLLHCDCPPNVLNVSGPETISTLWAAGEMGKLLGREPVFSGSTENGLRMGCIFPNTAKLSQLMGYPTMPLRSMMQMVAEWSCRRALVNAPTHFESTDGNIEAADSMKKQKNFCFIVYHTPGAKASKKCRAAPAKTRPPCIGLKQIPVRVERHVRGLLQQRCVGILAHLAPERLGDVQLVRVQRVPDARHADVPLIRQPQA